VALDENAERCAGTSPPTVAPPSSDHPAARVLQMFPAVETRRPNDIRRALRTGPSGIVRYPPSELLGGRALVAHRSWPVDAPVPIGEDLVWALWAGDDGAIHTAVAGPKRWKGIARAWLGEMFHLTPPPTATEAETPVLGLAVARVEKLQLLPPAVLPASDGLPSLSLGVAHTAAGLDADQRRLLDAGSPLEPGDIVRGVLTSAAVAVPVIALTSLTSDQPVLWIFAVGASSAFGASSMWRRHRLIDEQGASVVTHDELHAAQIRQALAPPRDGATR
jgi:hypothetical protein